MVDIRRVRYYQGQYLGESDFETEQDYHRSLRHRHNLGPHTWGIVAGLELIEQPTGGTGPSGEQVVDVFLPPGMALDGVGREIFVFEQRQLDPVDLQLQNVKTGTQPVWLAYDEEESLPPAFGYDVCEEDGQLRRIFEGYRLVYGPQLPDVTDHLEVKADPVIVAGAAKALGYSVPHQELPDGDKQRWLIPVGRVNWDAANQQFYTLADEERVRGRRYAGAVAATVFGPAGEIRFKDRRADLPGGSAGFKATVEGEAQVDELLTAKGDIQLHGGAIELRDTTGAEAGGVPVQPAVGIQRVEPGGGGGVDLALDLGAADQGDHRLAVRSNGQDRLTVADDGTTEIDGEVTIQNENDLIIDGGTLGITRLGQIPPNWQIGASIGNDLELRGTSQQLVLEVLDANADNAPALRLFGNSDAELSANQLIDLTDGGVTELHTHLDATTSRAGLVEIATWWESGENGSSGAPLVVRASDDRLLAKWQRDDLTDGGLTTLHRHNSPLLGNVEVEYLHANEEIEIVTIPLDPPLPKRVVALIIPNRFQLETGILGGGVSPVFATISAVAGGSLGANPVSIYTGQANSVTFRLACEDGHADATALVIWEDT